MQSPVQSLNIGELHSLANMLGLKPDLEEDFRGKSSRIAESVFRKLHQWIQSSTLVKLSLLFLLIFFAVYLTAPNLYKLAGLDVELEPANGSIPELMTSDPSEERSSTENTNPEPVAWIQEYQLDGPDALNYINSSLLVSDLYEAGFDIPNRDLCPELGESLKFLILVSSAQNNSLQRLAVRKTWGHYAQREDIAMAFVVGRTETPETTSDVTNFMTVTSESELYGDIVAGKFVDSDANLTLKTTAMLEWIDAYCPQVKFVLKADDDVYLNVPWVVDLVESSGDADRTIFGHVSKESRPVRNESDEHYVSFGEYSPPVWPNFVTGEAFLLSGDIAHELYMKALDTSFLSQESVFYTGFVAQAIDAKRVDVPSFLSFEDIQCDLKEGLFVRTNAREELFDLWSTFESGRNCT